ncbi:hypothetical protein V8D89_006717, partial [Ganoderma adspersum]
WDDGLGVWISSTVAWTGQSRCLLICHRKLCRRIRALSPRCHAMQKDSRIHSFYRTLMDTPVVRLATKYCPPALCNQAPFLVQEQALPIRIPRSFKIPPNPTFLMEDIHAIGSVNIALEAR